jgi:hypothetical protein
MEREDKPGILPRRASADNAPAKRIVMPFARLPENWAALLWV